MRGVVIWSLLGVLVIYLVIGGIVFWRLESGQQELNQKQTSVPVDEQLIIRLIGALNGKSFECFHIFEGFYQKVNMYILCEKMTHTK